MKLLHDLLDQQIIDSEQQKAGKVDGVAIEIRPDAPPRIAYIDVGMDVLARRFSSRLERFVQRLHRGWQADSRPPFQVPWDKVRNVAISVVIDVDDKDYSNHHAEDWLRERVITKIPGSALDHLEGND